MEDQPRPLDLKWSPTAPTCELYDRWDIKRPKGTTEIRGIIVSHNVTGLYVHYYCGRTRPCTGENCEACAANRRAAWKGYVAVTDTTCKEKWLFELTPTAAERLKKAFSEFRTLKGLAIKMRKANGRDNGPTWVAIGQQPVPAHALPDAPNVEARLCRIWEVHYNPAPRQLLEHPKPKLATGTDGPIDDGQRDHTLD